MCEAISWIELPSGGEKPAIFVLTDKEVFSPEGQKKLEGCRHNDFLGHGAVRKFFDIPRGSGEERENTMIWNPTYFPSPIKEYLQDFDKHWGKLFSEGYFQNDDLLRIIGNPQSPLEWKKKAFGQLERQLADAPAIVNVLRLITVRLCNPTSEFRDFFLEATESLTQKLPKAECTLTDFLSAIALSNLSDEQKETIWRAVNVSRLKASSLAATLTKFDKKEIPRKFALRIFKAMLQKNVSIASLFQLIADSDIAWVSKRAGEEILKRKDLATYSPLATRLTYLHSDDYVPPKFSRRIFKVLSEANVSAATLVRIVRYTGIPLLAKLAAEEALKRKDMTASELRTIAVRFTLPLRIRKEARDRFNQKVPKNQRIYS